MLESLLKRCTEHLRDEYANRVRCLVGTVIMTAKKKDGRDWQVDAIQNSNYERKFIGRLPLHRMKPLIVFLGGGGSKSAWYGSTISSTYEEFQHDRAGIPPYKMLKVPSSKDFTINVVRWRRLHALRDQLWVIYPVRRRAGNPTSEVSC